MARAVCKFLIKNWKRLSLCVVIGRGFDLTVARIAGFCRFFAFKKHFDVRKNFAEFDGRIGRGRDTASRFGALSALSDAGLLELQIITPLFEVAKTASPWP